MKQTLFDKNGEKAGEVQVPEKIFGIEWNPDLVHQVLVISQGNQRQVSAAARDRGEVRGGGKKPWRQKGTGRARHGSIRSPLWKGGGVTHGPTAERSYKGKVNDKMRRKALFSALSEKFRQKQVVVVDSLQIAEAKTKELAQVLAKLPSDKNSTLLVLPSLEKNVLLASRNLPYVKAVQARELTLLDVAQAGYIVVPQESLQVLEKTFVR